MDGEPGALSDGTPESASNARLLKASSFRLIWLLVVMVLFSLMVRCSCLFPDPADEGPTLVQFQARGCI